jgi:hypothetical protein
MQRRVSTQQDLIGYQVRCAFRNLGGNLEELAGIRSAAIEAKILKQQWMRTVPDFVSQCGGRLEAPRTQRSNECGTIMNLNRILVFEMVPGGGVEPPRSCLRRILSFPGTL